MDKRELRKQQLKKLRNMDKLSYEQTCYQITYELLRTKAWKQAKTIGVTVSKIPEINTWSIIQHAWNEGKNICVPKCNPSTKEMIFYKLESFLQLEKVYYDLYEPNPNVSQAVKKNEISCMIVPGVGFSETGYRLGFGGGYYDRYLKDYQGDTIALACTEHFIEHLPVEPFDIPVSQIITENGVIQCE